MTTRSIPDKPAPWIRNLIGVEDPDTPIYRTFRLIHFHAALVEQRMALVAPHLWEDPFENLVAHYAITDARGERWTQVFLGNARKTTFGQCWSLAQESDAFWRMYSTVRKNPTTARNDAVDDEGIKVRTTPSRLLRALWESCSSNQDQSCFLGSVRYFPQDVAVQMVADEIGRSMENAYASERGHAESLLIKRQPFEHEREVRLLFVDHDRTREGSQLHFVPIQPNTLFEEAILDPRLGADDVRAREEELRAFGFGGPIRRSDLYQRTLFEVVIR